MKQKQILILLHNESVAATCQLALLLIFPLALAVNQHQRQLSNSELNRTSPPKPPAPYRATFKVIEQLGFPGQSKSTVALNTRARSP